MLTCLSCIASSAQKKPDTLVYYLQTDGKAVSQKADADYIRVVLSPDTSVDKDLFRINEFYPNGKRKLITNSRTNNLGLKFQGLALGYFPNGHKMFVRTYEAGNLTGDETDYYPNGKLYCTKTFADDHKILLNDCRDSTGNVLAESGNGKWIKFLEQNFTGAFLGGQIINGKEEGIWRGVKNDSTTLEYEYKRGDQISVTSFDKSGNEIAPKIYTKPDQMPEFPGGEEAMCQFILKNTRYLAVAREENLQGLVMVSFTVEPDGSLTDVHNTADIGGGAGMEVVRVINSSPKWHPAYQGSKPVRAIFNIGVDFTIEKKGVGIISCKPQI